MIDELTQTVARTAQITPAQAALAVKAMLRFLTARLPSRIVGELNHHMKIKSVKTTALSDDKVICLPNEPSE
jgi:nucleoid DNA-binding protein